MLTGVSLPKRKRLPNRRPSRREERGEGQMTVSTEHGLVRYDAMCRAIDAAFDVDEAKDIRDKAVAMEAYFLQAKNTEAERRL